MKVIPADVKIAVNHGINLGEAMKAAQSRLDNGKGKVIDITPAPAPTPTPTPTPTPQLDSCPFGFPLLVWGRRWCNICFFR